MPTTGENENTCAPRTMYQYRYLAQPKPISTVYWPGIGDFVVLSIDPVASVSHLDKIARRAARKIPVHKFVALTTSGYGFPLETKPYTSFLIAPVRQGLPTLNHPPWDTPDMCYPIFPNITHPSGREAVRPLHPLPLLNCYFETTRPFLTHANLRCRVTTTPRDYTPVLKLPASELSRLEHLMDEEVHYRAELRGRLKDGDLHAFGSIPLPPSPLSLSTWTTPLPSSTPTSPLVLGRLGNEDTQFLSDDDSEDYLPIHQQHTADNVSIIGSDDDSCVSYADERRQNSGSEDDHDAADDQLDLMLRFEDWMNDTGSLRDPVVNVWYDLDMVTEVTDPMLYLEIREQLQKIIDDAEIRLGLRDDPASSRLSSTSYRQIGNMCENDERATTVASSSHSSLARPGIEQEPRASRIRRLLGKAGKVWYRMRRRLGCSKLW